MKALFVSMLVLVSGTQALAAEVGIGCMQISTNDGFLPNNVTIYTPADNTETLRMKFYIENDLREVIATKASEDSNFIKYGNVRLIEDGVIKGGPIGIKLAVEKSAYATGGALVWNYFDGAKAVYSCSPF